MTWAKLVQRVRREHNAAAALAIAVLALGYYLAAIRPLEGQAEGLRGRSSLLAKRAAEAPAIAAPAAPQAQLAEFYAQLPGVTEAPEVVSKLHRHARDAGLALEHGEYRPLTAASPRLLRYQIVLPVTGSYPQVRQFLLAAMQEMPHLALDGIDFRREEGDGARIEAQLRFTAFLKAAS